MQMLARSWFIYELTGRALLIGVMNLAFAIPMLSFSLFGGALADRIPKRTLLLFSNVLLAIMGVGLAVLITLDLINWWLLVLSGALNGTAMAFMGPARQAIIPELVQPRYLLNAISLGAAQMNITRIAAPGLAGFLIAWMGIETVFWLMGVLAAGAFALNLFLPAIRAVTDARKRTILRDMGQGLLYVKDRPVIRDLLIIAFVASIFGFPINLILPVFTEDVLQIGPGGLGMLVSMSALGALLGSLVLASLGDYRHKGNLMIILTIVFGGAIVLFTMARDFYLAVVALALVGVGQSCRMSLNQTLVQERADPGIRGRVMAVYQMETGLQPLGVLPVSAAAEIFGAPWAMGVSGGIVLIHAVFVLLFQPSIRKLE
jgi:MFS family permease